MLQSADFLQICEQRFDDQRPVFAGHDRDQGVTEGSL